jgi:hypothetical protein
MPDRQCQQQLLGAQHLNHDALRIVWAWPDEARVQLTLRDGRELPRCLHFRDPQHDPWALLAEGQHGGRQQARERRRGHVADLDMAEHAAAREAADGLRVLDLPQRASCLGQEQETGVGQNHGGPFASVEEGGAE